MILTAAVMTAWVLWAEYTVMSSGRTQWRVLHGYPRHEDCDVAAADRVVAHMANNNKVDLVGGIFVVRRRDAAVYVSPRHRGPPGAEAVTSLEQALDMKQ
jgi:hypothetical protein